MRPNEVEYLEEAGKYSCVSLIQEYPADVDTPVTLMKKIKARYLLESVNREGAVGRYSFISRGELCRITLRGDEVEIRVKGEEVQILRPANPIKKIRETTRRFTHRKLEDGPPFSCGFSGYLGYEAVRHWERVPTYSEHRDDTTLPDGVWILSEETLIYDLVERKTTCVVLTIPGGDPEGAYRDGVARLEKLMEELATTFVEDPVVNVPPASNEEEPAEEDRAVFCNAVRKSREAIIQGELIQVVISRKEVKRSTVTAEKIYRTLRRLNPSPYLFYLDFEEYQLIGSSPEVMIKVQDGKLLLRPIAGTRPRGRTPEEDERMERELLADPKERAEHLMLVDLARNDLGRVAVPGSVKVTDYQSVERYSHVMHLVSTVEAEVADGVDVFSVIGAVFPAGTLTGAPKVRAMELLHQFEGERRGPYGGMIFHMDLWGNLDSCITIRTIVKRGDRIEVRAGAGIVHPSDPDREYDETRSKAAVLLRALEEAEK